jgi:hypothetical protein
MKEHGEKGHLNIYKRDQDSVVTGYGKHHRVVAFLPDAEGLSVRVDHKHGDREPTIAEILKVARLDQGIKGRWVLRSVERGYYNPATECEFTEYNFSRSNA